MIVVRLQPPHLPVPEIVQQGRQVSPGNLPGPDDLGTIDIRTVVDPLLVRVVIGGVMDQNEVFARSGFQLPKDLGALPRPSRPGQTDFGLEADCNHRQQHNQAREEQTDGSSAELRMAKMPHRLNQQDEECCGKWCDVMGLKPYHGHQAGQTKSHLQEG